MPFQKMRVCFQAGRIFYQEQTLHTSLKSLERVFQSFGRYTLMTCLGDGKDECFQLFQVLEAVFWQLDNIPQSIAKFQILLWG